MRFDIPSGYFTDILSPYRDNGLEPAIKDALEHIFTGALYQAYPNDVMQLCFSHGANRDLSVQQILLDGFVSIRLPCITIDLKKGGTELYSVTNGTNLRFARWNWPDGIVNYVPAVKYHDMATRDRYRLRQVCLIIDVAAFPWTKDDTDECACENYLVRPVMTGMHSRDYPLWHCIFCGQQYRCTCNVIEATGQKPNQFVDPESGALWRTECCHLCREIRSEMVYRSRMYCGDIYSRYEPYIHELMFLRDLNSSDAENRVRDRLGLPRIGEGWLKQMQVTRLVETIYADHVVEREASPQWLEGQRFDVFLPEVGVAVEYQGEQHFGPVTLFGGENGFKKTQQRDQDKRRKAKENSVVIVEFTCDEKVTESLVQKRIDEAIRGNSS